MTKVLRAHGLERAEMEELREREMRAYGLSDQQIKKKLQKTRKRYNIKVGWLTASRACFSSLCNNHRVDYVYPTHTRFQAKVNTKLQFIESKASDAQLTEHFRQQLRQSRHQLQQCQVTSSTSGDCLPERTQYASTSNRTHTHARAYTHVRTHASLSRT